MIKNEEKKTTLKMRILVAGIAVFTLGATFALYAGIVLNYSNQGAATEKKNKLEAKFNELYQAYQDDLDKYYDAQSDKYFDDFLAYKGNVKAFNASDAQKELKTKDLKKGDGEKVTYEKDDDGNITGLNTDYNAYYIGWLSDETIFDSSFNDASNPSSLKKPLAGNLGYVQGWIEGVEGMRIGGVREITIPSALGYGSQESGSIPADSPLKFIVMLVEPGDEPEPSQELQDIYTELYGE